MKRKVFIAYIILVLIIFIGINYRLGSVDKYILKNRDNIIVLNNFMIDKKVMNTYEHKVIDSPNKIFDYSMKISSNKLEKISGDAILIMTRYRGNWHKIYFNNRLIGSIGDESNYRINLWNETYKFSIDKTFFEEENIIRIVSYSNYKLGHGKIPILLTNSNVGYDLFRMIKVNYNSFYSIIMYLIFIVSILEIIIFIVTKATNKKNLLFPFVAMIGSIFILDYRIIVHTFMSNLLFKKLTMSSLYFSSLVMSIALYKRYEKKLTIIVGSIFCIVASVGFIISDDFSKWNKSYKILNILLLITTASWILVLIKEFIKENDYEALTIAFGTFILIGFGAIDVINIYFDNIEQERVAIFGIILFIISILFIAMVDYVDNQKKIYFDFKKIEIEKERLDRALIYDELTGLFNHRSLFDKYKNAIDSNIKTVSLIYIDVDRFRNINEMMGYEKGDKLLLKLSKIICDVNKDKESVFRYGGEEFIVTLNDNKNQAYKLSEKIRLDVIDNEELQHISGYLPLTISIGISQFPDDSINFKTVVNKAEQACFLAKQGGRNQTKVYSKVVDDKLNLTSESYIKKQVLLDFIYTLASAIDMKDKYTGDHSVEVSRYSTIIAEELGLNNDLKYFLQVGALLHDLGKLSVPDSIIQKKGNLTDNEYKIVKNHPVVGYNIVKELVDDDEITSCVRWHHERYDGNGYPDGLKGEEIPLLSRIVCVADSYHAMISSRSYREGLPIEIAISELKDNSSTQFDSKVVDALVKHLSE